MSPLLSMKTLIVASALTVLAGCSTMTNKEVGQIDFSYSVPEQEQAADKLIAVVTPDFKDNNAAAPAVSNNPFLAMAMANQASVSVNFNANFNQSYRAELLSSMQNTIKEIISKKGFRTSEYSSFDDMTYIDKKSTYLASVPKLSLVINKKTTAKECKHGYCSEEGVIQITGELNVSFIEPLTQQVFINKRINLSDLNISKEYIKQADTRGSHGVGGLINLMFKPKVYSDNTDKALTEALNEFYTKAAEKIVAYVSREEFLSLEGDINDLKNIKRF